MIAEGYFQIGNIPDAGSGELQGLSYTVALFLWLPETCAELLPVSEIFPNLTSLFSSEVVSSAMTISLELPAESKPFPGLVPFHCCNGDGDNNCNPMLDSQEITKDKLVMSRYSCKIRRI